MKKEVSEMTEVVKVREGTYRKFKQRIYQTSLRILLVSRRYLVNFVMVINTQS